MAEAIGVAGSIVGIASAGIAVVSALTKFSISIRGSNDKINSLAGRVSLTVSILSDIGKAVQAHESGFKNHEFRRTWGSVLDACLDSYQRIDTALAKTRRAGKNNDEKKVSVWGKLVWALGGEAEMRDLEASLERCCQQVMMMQQAVQMSVLSLIAQRQQLNSTEAEERRELMGKLEWLLSSLSASGILPGENPKEKPVIVVHDTRYPQDTPAVEVDYSGNKAPPADNSKGGFSAQGTEGQMGSLSQGLAALLPNIRSSGGRTGSTSQGPRDISSSPIRPMYRPEEAAAPLADHQNEPFFEAFYIVPRSLPRHQEKGELQVAKPSYSDYMIICVDIGSDYYKDQNVRSAVRSAKRLEDLPTLDEFPRSVRETAKWLTNHRRDHTYGIMWHLAFAIELDYLDGSFFGRSSSRSGYLVVLRGIRAPDRSESRDRFEPSSSSRSWSRSRSATMYAQRMESEPKRRDRPVRRPVYYSHGPSYLIPERSGTAGRERRSSSTGHGSSPPLPVIINNRISNDEDEDDDDTERYRRPQSARLQFKSRYSASEYELEKTRKELEVLEQGISGDRENKHERMQKYEMELKAEIEEARRKVQDGEIRRRPAVPVTYQPSEHSRSDSLDSRDLYSRRDYRPIPDTLPARGSRSRERHGRERILVEDSRRESEGHRRRRHSETPVIRRERSSDRDDESEVTLVNDRAREREVHVSQQQAETMVMDFLATFTDVKRSSF